jgi:hypothetical protein
VCVRDCECVRACVHVCMRYKYSKYACTICAYEKHTRI